jgi:hypothetical protein
MIFSRLKIGNRFIGTGGSFLTTVDPKIKMVFEIPTNDLTLEITLRNGYNFDADIDWGDGLIEHVHQIGTNNNISHTYIDAGTRTIIIKGQWEALKFGYYDNKLRKVLDFGHPRVTKLKYINFAESTLNELPSSNPLSSFKNINDASESFGYYDKGFAYTKITHIPADLFKGCTLLTDIKQAFQGCDDLTTIDPSAFSGLVNITDMFALFDSCGLTTLPSDLFKFNANLDRVEMMFNSCSDLTALPSDLFANNINITNFSQTFQQCTTLSGNVPDFWNSLKWPNVVDHNQCFYRSENITNINDIPPDWK